MMNRRQEVLTVMVFIMLVFMLALQVRGLIAARQPFTQYCDWVQPGSVLRCHR